MLTENSEPVTFLIHRRYGPNSSAQQGLDDAAGREVQNSRVFQIGWTL